MGKTAKTIAPVDWEGELLRALELADASLIREALRETCLVRVELLTVTLRSKLWQKLADRMDQACEQNKWLPPPEGKDESMQRYVRRMAENQKRESCRRRAERAQERAWAEYNRLNDALRAEHEPREEVRVYEDPDPEEPT